jgi:hypothetical protein
MRVSGLQRGAGRVHEALGYYLKGPGPSEYICCLLQTASKPIAPVAQGIQRKEEGRAKPTEENPTLVLGYVLPSALLSYTRPPGTS